MKIQKVRIRNFKNIEDIEIQLDDLNLLIGGNNAGKSSIIQGIHFTISALRAARIYGKSDGRPATTLGVNQFTFLPTQEIMEIAHKFPMTQNRGPKFDYVYLDEEGIERDFSLHLYRGKNANISLTYPAKNKFFSRASDITRPFSVFVPGLAGIPLSEERRANSIVQSGIAQGDANLFLRNVLHRLDSSPEKKLALRSLMQTIFPGFDFRTQFDENVNQYIYALVTLEGKSTPLEMAGTGCLQALQLASYVILYTPEFLLLDEPDAHLHPGNQKLLVELLFTLSKTSSTQIVLASHSRHVFDAIQNNPLGSVHWLSKGKIVDDQDADAGLLLEIGALDKLEELKSEEPKLLILSEDEKRKNLEIILESNGVDLDSCLFLTYNGVDNLEATSIVSNYFRTLSDESRVLIYRDGDCMTPDERKWAIDRYADIANDDVLMLISSMTDIEHLFCSPQHVADVCNIDFEVAFQYVESVVDVLQAKLSSKLTLKRNDLKFKILRQCPNRAATHQVVGDRVSFQYSLGKLLLPRLEEHLRQENVLAGSLVRSSAALAIPELQEFIQGNR